MTMRFEVEGPEDIVEMLMKTLRQFVNQNRLQEAVRITTTSQPHVDKPNQKAYYVM
jgi:hypothetical protein